MKYISDCSLSEIIFKLQEKELTPEKLIDELCDKLDKWDTKIHAFLPENNRRERLHNELEQIYQKFPDQETRPILFGIPIGIKDIFRVDGFPTKAGSKLPSKLFSGKEATCLTKLKNAGALILGKTVTTEFAYFEPGPTKNPHNLEHTPGGSSSGSAAAVAAGFCPLNLGTQTIGSIIRPASYCGIIGFKPTSNRIPTDSVIPFSPSMDQIGFFAQDLKGIEIASSVLCKDWDSKKLLSNINKKPILAVPDGKYLEQSSKEILNFFWEKISKLEKKGFPIKKIETFENIEKINNVHQKLISFELANVHKNWFSKYRELYSDSTSEMILEGQNISKQEISNALKEQKILRKELGFLQNKHKFNIWISPSTTTDAPKGLKSTGSPLMNLPWTFVGFPTITIPVGKSKRGLPLGLQFSADFGQDEKLLDLIKEIIRVFP